jgi:radical SAM superfamily enzyme YgiQ (UPF0313 family)
MIGLPGETSEQMERTVSFLGELQPWTFSMGMFTPHPGSQLYEELKAAGSLPTGGRWKEAIEGNPSEVSDAELARLLRRTYLRYYLEPARLARFARDRRQWGTLARASAGMITKLATRSAQ